jgi:PPOX class probable F420-dependent enzyme
LAVVVTLRDDGSAHTSVVNAGVLRHPLTGHDVVGFVVRGPRLKLRNLRARPRATLVFRSGWEWVAVDGRAELVGPDDELSGFDAAELPRLLREVYAAAAGGDPDDWAALDDEMADERHTAVLVDVDGVYPSAAE